ncbi:MAG: hypothetical protein J6C27_03190, partial [Clostridia bacterium]|nr:hypothetical protein [Clostridia bacterium]
MLEFNKDDLLGGFFIEVAYFYIKMKEVSLVKCLMKYQWVKLPRNHLPEGKGIMSAWAKLASRAAFRKGQAS